MDAKIMLIMGCSELEGEKGELKIIEAQARLYGIETIFKELSSHDDLVEALNQGIKFDYIYLSAHGNEDGFADKSGNIDLTWTKFGEWLHNNDCLSEDSFLLLSCCRSGLNDVAFDLINFCPNVQYVCGPRTSLSTEEVAIGFNIFLYNIEYRNIDPVVACEKIKHAADLRFICFDRLEVVTDTAYLIRSKKYQIIEVDLDEDGVKDEIIIQRIKEKEMIYSDEESLEHTK